MRRFIPLFLALCLLLGACGNQSAQMSTTGNTEASTEPSTDPSTEPSTEPTEPPILYRHPLNGTPLDTPWTGRPTAVVLNNIKAALPQHGVSDADILYEIETEGGITRCLAIYSDVSQVDIIGPVRSARTYFNNIAVSYDAPIIHCGGSTPGRNAGYADSSDKISGWAHIDQVYNGSYFYRDSTRRKQGYATEHTLFTTGEKLLLGLTDKEYNTVTENSTDFGLTFDSEVSLNGAVANTITVSFLGKKTTTMTYNSTTRLYEAAQYDKEYIDGNSGEVLTFKNVMVLYTKQWKKSDGTYYRSYYDLTGSGEGLLAIDGKIVPINWSREGLRTDFAYTLADGTPITLAEGHTYIAVTSTSSTPVQYQ